MITSVTSIAKVASESKQGPSRFINYCRVTFSHLYAFNPFCIEILYLVKPWPYENFNKCLIFIYIWAGINYFIIIMRNKLLILLFASTCANFLDVVLPKTCPWVFPSVIYPKNPVLARNLLVFRDEDIAAKCEGQCELAYIDCTVACSNTNCLTECGRVFTDCVNGGNV